MACEEYVRVVNRPPDGKDFTDPRMTLALLVRVSLMLPLLQRQVFTVLSHQSRRQSTFFRGQRSFTPYLWVSIFLVSSSLALRPAIRLDADIPKSMEFESGTELYLIYSRFLILKVLS